MDPGYLKDLISFLLYVGGAGVSLIAVGVGIGWWIWG